MSVNEINISGLSIEEEEEVTTIYVSLMSKMRTEYDAIAAMELDDDLEVDSGIESVEELKPELKEEEENATGDTEVVILKRNRKKVHRDFSDLQIEAFLDLLNNGISTTPNTHCLRGLKRGHRSIQLPPYLSKLNYIENFWSTMALYVLVSFGLLAQ